MRSPPGLGPSGLQNMENGRQERPKVGQVWRWNSSVSGIESRSKIVVSEVEDRQFYDILYGNEYISTNVYCLDMIGQKFCLDLTVFWGYYRPT